MCACVVVGGGEGVDVGGAAKRGGAAHSSEDLLHGAVATVHRCARRQKICKKRKPNRNITKILY